MVAEAAAEEAADCRRPPFSCPCPFLSLVPVVVIVRGRRRRRRRTLGLAIHLVAEGVGFRYELGRKRAGNTSVIDLG